MAVAMKAITAFALCGTVAGSDTHALATPIQRVVGLLEEMSQTISSEQAEDKSLYAKLKCWCNDNNWEKGNAVEAAQNKISELEAAIKAGTARSAELNQQIKDLEAEFTADKKALAEATALRKKQLDEFHGYELDAIQNVENIKAALTVMAKHEGGVAYGEGGADSFGKTSDSWSLLQKTIKSKDEPWTDAHEIAHVSQPLDEYMSRNGFADGARGLRGGASQQGLLQADAHENAGLSAAEKTIVQKAMRSMAAFAQTHQDSGYMPGYNSQSGEILGVMKQLKEEMEGDLSESQRTERDRGAAFDELRAAKTSEIENGEKMAETKEDELADTDNALAEAKEDLGQTQATLDELQKFLANMGATCAEAQKNFETRTQARADETAAVAQTIEILTSDEARDNAAATYSFVQIASASQREQQSRKQVAQNLRRMAAKTGDPKLAMLATSVELDAFTKVKKAIDDMISILGTQQKDEVKKVDWCKTTLQETEMTTLKTEDRRGDLEAHEAKLTSDIEALAKRLQEAAAEIAELQVNLQRANENRKTENMDFQKTVADQTLTVQILKKALDKLANYYDLLHQKQTPPVAQGEYGKSAGAEGVMQMIEKLVGEAQTMTKDARKEEGEAQAAYEQFVADTNDSVANLQKEVTTKTKTKAKTEEQKMQTQADIADTVAELEGLSKYTGELHAECDYVMKNFDVRQNARADEIASLQQAKQILSGASA